MFDNGLKKSVRDNAVIYALPKLLAKKFLELKENNLFWAPEEDKETAPRIGDSRMLTDIAIAATKNLSVYTNISFPESLGQGYYDCVAVAEWFNVVQEYLAIFEEEYVPVI